MPLLYAQIVPLGAPIDREMTYSVPDDLRETLQLGSRVLIPFGVRWLTGIVVGQSNTIDFAPDRVKAIGQILDPYPLIEPHLIKLCQWIAQYYVCNPSEVFSAALPAGIHLDSGRHVALNEQAEIPKGLLSKRQADVVTCLTELESASIKQLERRLGKQGIQSAVHGLIQRGLLNAFQKMDAPRVKTKTERIAELVPNDPRWFELELPKITTRAPKQAACIRLLQDAQKPLPVTQLAESGIAASVIRALAERNLIRINQQEVRRDPYAELNIAPPEDLSPTQHQRTAIDEITNSLNQKAFQVHMLHGVTGSGKTLVYIEAVAHALKQGQGAIVLVPEITLTPQTVRRFRAHFGAQVAVMHSALSEGERYDAWREVREGKRPVVIGARSAIFAPIQNLGLIIIDEEHDGSYKQSDPAPRYNARDVAVMRAKLQNATVVLGSATPSLESYQNAKTQKFNLITLPERIDNRPMPTVTLVDMRTEGGTLFSKPLREKMHDRLRRDERIILLQNRRGYAPTVQCTGCGSSIECPHCQVTLTYHAAQQTMLCHYCAYTQKMPENCPSCHNRQLQMLGVGTQRVEETIEQQFPSARILRMDMDSTQRKGAHDRILERFSRGEADILLGTQMVAKGLDFPGVTLVGVISADTGIHLPDFRASERTFQLLTQVSGRAGRGELPGEVVVQTYMPDGEAVQCAQTHDFLEFSQREMGMRQTLRYPPFGRMVLLLFKGRDEHEVAQTAGICAGALRAETPPDVEIMGPVQAPLSRIQKTYRWQVVVRSESHSHLNTVARKVKQQFAPKKRRGGGVTVSIDVDPISML
ncbi:MAG: primosomal protein N' [Candidatus Latescibacteria bacterium]|jgi:primosomal protein N' (replication factor Y) (superfamily II helicase)|nr:primosomal protein N' [Candidatus Latescibacterota bacterium]